MSDGGDARYGRLFTEVDVERIIAEALIQQHKRPPVRAAAVIAEVEWRYSDPFTFPDDEPLFLLRGQDALAGPTLMSYAMVCDDVRTSQEHRDGAWNAHDVFVDWQAEHPDRVKVPS